MIQLNLAILKKLQLFCKYLNISPYGKKQEVCDKIQQTLVVRKLQFAYFKKKKYHCCICMDELYPPIQKVFGNNRFHSDCLILCINATGEFVEPIYKNKLTMDCLESLRNQCSFLNLKFISIDLDKIDNEHRKNEEENSLLQAIYGTISEYEINRSMLNIQELQIFLQFFFSLNPNYSLFIMKNLIEIKKDDLNFQHFLISILHRFEANMNESKDQFEKTKLKYKTIYCELQQQAFIPQQFFETNVFENLLSVVSRNRNRRRLNTTPSSSPSSNFMIEGGPQTRNRTRRANHVFFQII